MGLTKATIDVIEGMVCNDLSNITETAVARANLGLAIGTDVEPFDETIIKAKDIGTKVQPFDGSIIKGKDIGKAIQQYDAKTSKLNVSEKRTASLDMDNNPLRRAMLINYTELAMALGSSNIINLGLANVFTKTLSSSTTLKFTGAPPSSLAGSFTIILTNTGSHSLTWPTSVDWAGGEAPTLTDNGVDILTFTTLDAGNTWYGFASGMGMG